MLKAGQRPKHPMQVMAVGVEEYPVRFTVARAFADKLEVGDLVAFLGHPRERSSLWAKTWRVVRVDKHTDDTRKVYVVEAT